MKQIIYFIFVLIMINYVYGIYSCSETKNPSEQCNIITPVIICDDYFYDIYNNTGDNIIHDNLTVFADGTYYFTFNESIGQYTIILCDNSTIQIYSEIDVVKDNINNLWGEFTMIVLYGIFAVCLVLGLKYVSQLLLFTSSAILAIIGFMYVTINNMLWNLTGVILIIIAGALFINIWFYRKGIQELN